MPNDQGLSEFADLVFALDAHQAQALAVSHLTRVNPVRDAGNDALANWLEAVGSLLQAQALAVPHLSRVNPVRDAGNDALANWLEAVGSLLQEGLLSKLDGELLDGLEQLDLSRLLRAQSRSSLKGLVAFYENGARNTRAVKPMRALCDFMAAVVADELRSRNAR